MNVNPYGSTGKKLIYGTWALMALAMLSGYTPPMWSIMLNLGLGGYLIYKGKL